MGETILTETVVLRINKNKDTPNNVVNQLFFEELNGYNNQEVRVSISEIVGKTESDLLTFTTKVYKTEPGVTLKVGLVREHNLVPGQELKVEISEINQQINHTTPQEATEFTILDNVSAVRDTGNSDGLDSCLNSSAVYSFIGMSRTKLRYKNLRTGDTTTRIVDPLSTGNKIQFPSGVRKQINAKAEDRIEIAAPVAESDASASGDIDKDTREKVDEMHEILTELYAESDD